MTTDLCFVRRFHTYVLVPRLVLDTLGRTREMFGLVFVSDGQNEDPLITALILIAQLALLLCEIISVCYTCRCTCMCVEKRENALVQADVPLYNTCSMQKN